MIARTMISRTMMAAIAGFAMIAGATEAMPLTSVGPGATTDVIQVAGGCGPGRHRGPYGGCLRNFANPAAHACPRGFHVGPYGRCRGNGR